MKDLELEPCKEYLFGKEVTIWKEKGVCEDYDEFMKYPYYRMRGKKIGREAAARILIKEAESAHLKPNRYFNMPLDPLDHTCAYNLRAWLDENGNVGENNVIAGRNPYYLEFLEENYYYAKQYPEDLEYIIIYSGYNCVDWEVDHKFCGDPPWFYDMSVEAFAKKFDYAVWVKNGEIYVVSKEAALRLYDEYQSQYPSEEMFVRLDYSRLIRPLVSQECRELLMEARGFTEESKEEIREHYRNRKDLNGLKEDTLRVQKTWLKEAEEIRSGKESPYRDYQDCIEMAYQEEMKRKELEILEDAIKSGNLGLKDLKLREKIWDPMLAWRYDANECR